MTCQNTETLLWLHLLEDQLMRPLCEGCIQRSHLIQAPNIREHNVWNTPRCFPHGPLSQRAASQHYDQEDQTLVNGIFWWKCKMYRSENKVTHTILSTTCVYSDIKIDKGMVCDCSPLLGEYSSFFGGETSSLPITCLKSKGHKMLQKKIKSSNCYRN